MKIACSLTVLLLVTSASTSWAQPRCPYECRGQFPYGSCSKSPLDHPEQGAIGFTGTVLASTPIECGNQISVQISRSTRPLPAKIQIAVQLCLYWAGKIGETLTAAVAEQPSPAGVYRPYACWG